MLQKMTWLVSGLVVFPERMQHNLQRVRGLVFSQAVLLALTDAGVSREESYRWVQRCAMQVWDEDRDFHDCLSADADVVKHLGQEGLDRCFDLRHQLRNVEHIFQRTLEQV